MVQSAAAYFPPSADWRAYDGPEYLRRAHRYLAASNFVLAYNYANCARVLMNGEDARRQVEHIFACYGENMLNEAELLIQQKDFDTAIARITAATSRIAPFEKERVQRLYNHCGKGLLEKGIAFLNSGDLERARSQIAFAVELLDEDEKKQAETLLRRNGPNEFYRHFEQGKQLLATDFNAAYEQLMYAKSLDPTHPQLNELLDELEGERPL